MRSNAAVAQVGIITFGKQAQKIFEAMPKASQDIYIKKAAEEEAKHCLKELTGRENPSSQASGKER